MRKGWKNNNANQDTKEHITNQRYLAIMNFIIFIILILSCFSDVVFESEQIVNGTADCTERASRS